MPSAISNTSPLVYLYRIQVIEWLPRLFDEVWIPAAVANELKEGQRRGYDVPDPAKPSWLRVVNPKAMPVEWLALDLGAGELAAMALALENPNHVVILDDQLARRTGQAAGLNVWGTLKVLLEGKAQGITKEIRPLVNELENAGMWLSADVRQRILKLAHEGEE
jgi:predicted nucleic acid-binding protein